MIHGRSSARILFRLERCESQTQTQTLKLRKRCLDNLEDNDFPEPPTKVKFCQAGGDKKKFIPEVCESMYDWFIGICSSLKARLQKSIFKAQCKMFYEQWLSQQEK